MNVAMFYFRWDDDGVWWYFFEYIYVVAIIQYVVDNSKFNYIIDTFHVNGYIDFALKCGNF